MGYCIATRVKSKELQNKMLDFLKKEFKEYHELNPSVKYSLAGKPSKNLSYDKSKQAIGISYNSGLHGYERIYVFAIVKWMALKIGKTTQRFTNHTTTQEHPVFVYDGDEKWPVIYTDNIKNVPENLQWACCDEYGIKIDKSDYAHDLILDLNQKMFDKVSIILSSEKDIKTRNIRIYKLINKQVDSKMEVIRKEIQRLDNIWSS